MIVDIETYARDMKISYFDSEGKIKLKKYYLDSCQNWVLCSPNDPKRSKEFTNWDGKPVKKKDDQRLNKFSILEFLRNLPDSEKEEVCSLNFPSIQSVDIETEVIDAFPNPEIARERITTVGISFDNERTMVMGWKPISKEQEEWIFNEHNKYLKDHGNWKFKYVCFDDEREMLYNFITKILPKCSLVTGWNFIGFDWKYIYNRCKRLGLEPGDASPSKRCQGKDNIPLHLAMVDYMEIYKKWDRTVAIKESNKLDFVANQVLGVTKLKYQGSLQELYENDYDKYVLYNAIDTALVTLIHRKLKTLNAPFSVATISNLSIYRASSPVALTEALLWNGFYDRKQVIANERIDSVKGEYEGAYVKEPEPGFFKAACCFDFASLYPSIMRQYNISPESFKRKERDTTKLKNLREHKEDIVCVNGAIYDNQKESVMKEIMTRLYGQRREHKDLHLKIQLYLSRRKK